jgi:hypothetical protein
MPKQVFEDDPDAPASAEEQRLAEELRGALEDPKRSNESADLARALKNAHEPSEIDAREHAAIVERAIVRGFAARRGRVIRVAFGVGVVFAAAAAIALIVGKPRMPQGEDVQLAVARTTQPLFTEPFAKSGGESARIDRIAMARASDLRENRFAKWGVR